jgi:hypothetical protein
LPLAPLALHSEPCPTAEQLLVGKQRRQGLDWLLEQLPASSARCSYCTSSKATAHPKSPQCSAALDRRAPARCGRTRNDAAHTHRSALPSIASHVASHPCAHERSARAGAAHRGRPSPRVKPERYPAGSSSAARSRSRRALRDQHPAKAISDLDAYAANFPNAELALEAEVLRVHAMMAARQPSAAAALAERLLHRPGSEQYRADLRRALAVTGQLPTSMETQ